MLRSSVILLSVLATLSALEAGNARKLFDFTRPEPSKGWTPLNQPTGTATITKGRNFGQDPSLRIAWRVKKKSQDWLIVSHPFGTPIDRKGYRYLTFDVYCGLENRFINLKLVGSANTAEDSLNNLEPTVIPGRWAHVQVDLDQLGVGDTLSQIAFFLGTHWKGVETNKDYTIDLANVVLERGQEIKYVPPIAEVRPKWNFFFADETVVLKVIDRRREKSPLRLVLCNSKKILTERNLTIGEKGMTVDIGKLPPEHYEVRLGHLDNATFTCLPRQASYSRYDWNNAIEVNGEVIFPVGMHFLEENASDTELAECATAGFNSAPRPADHPANAMRILDRIQKATGGRTLLLTGPFDNGEQKSTQEYWKDVVSDPKVRRHPALLGWYIDDEPIVALIPELSGVTKFVKECDPYHLTYVVLNSPVVFKPFAPHFDLLGGDIYPFPGRPIAVIGDYFDKLGQTCHYRKPMIAVLQAFRDVGFSQPPPQAVRAMTYLSIVHGAKGVIYYAYRHQGGLPNDQIWRVPQSDPALWQEMKKIAGELREFSDLFRVGQDLPIPLPEIPSAVHYRLLDHQAKRYLLLVNTEQNSTGLNVNLPGISPRTEVRDIFGNHKFTGTSDPLHFKIPGYGVLLYRWTSLNP